MMLQVGDYLVAMIGFPADCLVLRLCRLTTDLVVLIDERTGNRWTDPVESIEDAIKYAGWYPLFHARTASPYDAHWLQHTIPEDEGKVIHQVNKEFVYCNGRWFEILGKVHEDKPSTETIKWCMQG